MENLPAKGFGEFFVGASGAHHCPQIFAGGAVQAELQPALRREADPVAPAAEGIADRSDEADAAFEAGGLSVHRGALAVGRFVRLQGAEGSFQHFADLGNGDPGL